MKQYGKTALKVGKVLYGIPNGFRHGIAPTKQVKIETVGRKYINKGLGSELRIEMDLSHYPQADTMIASDSSYYYYQSERFAKLAALGKQQGIEIMKADFSLTGPLPLSAIEEIHNTLTRYGALKRIND